MKLCVPLGVYLAKQSFCKYLLNQTHCFQGAQTHLCQMEWWETRVQKGRQATLRKMGLTLSGLGWGEQAHSLLAMTKVSTQVCRATSPSCHRL